MSYLSTFELLAELAISLVGFAAVAAAFAGRDRKYSDMEVIRLRTLFQLAGVIIFGTLCIPSLVSAGILDETAYRIVGVVSALYTLVLAIHIEPSMFRAMQNTKTSLSSVRFFLSYSLATIAVVLFAMDAIWIGQAWPLISAYTLLLLFGLWIFLLLLTQRN